MCEHSNFRPVLRESKINSSASSIDDGDELFFFEIGLGDVLLGDSDGDGPVVSSAESLFMQLTLHFFSFPQHTLRMYW